MNDQEPLDDEDWELGGSESALESADRWRWMPQPPLREDWVTVQDVDPAPGALGGTSHGGWFPSGTGGEGSGDGGQ